MSTLEARLQEALGGAYRLERELGGGGMSRVFVAEELELGRRVVVKVLPPDTAAGLNAERFRREIQLAASLQHPHVVPLIAAGRAGDLVWYTMPLISGESLRAKLAREGELPVSEAVRILRDVADALAYAHGQGVVHRDIKPDNVLISGRHAVVTDFGVAKAVSASTGGSSLTSIGVALGTPAYMAPEQASADPHVDHRADIYSLGAMAYEMLTGHPPFEGAPQAVLAAHVTQPPDKVSARRQSVPPALAALVMRCLEKRAADRYQSASELHEQLELMATPSGGAVPTSAVAATPAAAGRGKLIAAGAAVAVLLAAAATLFALRPWERPATSARFDPGIVAVLPFRVAGADPSLHYLRQGMLDLLQAKLTGEGGPRAADARSVLSAFREAGGSDEEDVPDGALPGIARKVGAGRVLQGSIVGPPEHVVISATLLEVPGSRTVGQTSVEGPKDSLFAMVDQLTARLLALGAGASQQELSTLTTTNLDALRAYLDGQSAYRHGAFERANQMLARAVQLDSTFALALSAWLEASGWSRAPIDVERVRRLAWQHRDRLSPRDQLVLTVRLGARYPRETPWTQRIADAERATAELPESPEVWYQLGDALFHYGALADIADRLVRAQQAFERAVHLDSVYAGPVSHLATLAVLRGDTATARRWATRAVSLDSAGVGPTPSRFELALLQRDTGALRRMIEAERSVSLAALGPFFVSPLDSLVYAERAFLLDLARRRATTAEDRAVERNLRLITYWNSGRPTAARALLDSLSPVRETDPTIPYLTAAAALFWDGDTTGLQIPSAAGREAEVLREYWNLRRGNLSSVNETVRRLRTDFALRDTIAERHVRLASLLEAWAAVERQAPDARASVLAADSAWVGWQQGSELAARPLAELLDRVGEPRRALTALRRREHLLSTPPPPGLIPDLLVEARLAARVGDREGAVRAYRGYLLWRSDPEQRLVPQRDSARRELARLTGP